MCGGGGGEGGGGGVGGKREKIVNYLKEQRNMNIYIYISLYEAPTPHQRFWGTGVKTTYFRVKMDQKSKNDGNRGTEKQDFDCVEQGKMPFFSWGKR